jgi:ATP-dependent Clp protease ATP-binding subunit ClpC
LTKPDLIEILDLEITKVMQRLKARNIVLQLDEKAKDFLVGRGYDPQYGARPMRRAVERFLEDPLAEEILKGSFHEGEPILVSADADHLLFNQKAAAEGALSS